MLRGRALLSAGIDSRWYAILLTSAVMSSNSSRVKFCGEQRTQVLNEQSPELLEVSVGGRGADSAWPVAATVGLMLGLMLDATLRLQSSVPWKLERRSVSCRRRCSISTGEMGVGVLLAVTAAKPGSSA